MPGPTETITINAWLFYAICLLAVIGVVRAIIDVTKPEPSPFE